MVTSNKLPDKKVVKMGEPNNSMVVPQRTLLGEINEHIMCPLCRGYYIDATTIVECLHSFCRSCIIKHLQVKSYCPVCEMMINSAKPNIKPDKALQDIVYKLVPGLFQKEMERRQQFYASRPGPAASATPEQRGEDTERIIFSPEDVISFSLEFADATDTDSISSKSSDSSEPQSGTASTRRFLQCPAVVNISHLKKFVSMKFDIDSSQFSIDILYKRVPLPDYYTLMDIAYIYNWKRNEPMRFFYQITDFIAIRNRYGLFDINRKGSHFGDRKSSPTHTDDTNASSPATNTNEQGFEMSSGTDSPMPDDSNNSCKKSIDTNLRMEYLKKEVSEKSKIPGPGKSDDEVEKSQFLNSFELKAANNSPESKSPQKSDKEDKKQTSSEITPKSESSSLKSDENNTKRKSSSPVQTSDVKKIKTVLEREKANQIINKGVTSVPIPTKLFQSPKGNDEVKKDQSSILKSDLPLNKVQPTKESKLQTNIKQTIGENPSKNKAEDVTSSPKCKLPMTSKDIPIPTNKPIPALKLQPSRHDTPGSMKPVDVLKPTAKRIPDLRPGVPPSHQPTQRPQPKSTKFQMDLLANNSDPTIDRSKILSQVKTSMGLNSSGHKQKPETWKSLFDSCQLNIPSSLSITLTDQKLDQRNSNSSIPADPKKNILNKKLSAASTASACGHKVPSPPVHNFIEILKLPETESKKPTNKVETKLTQNTIPKTDANVTIPKQPPKTEQSTSEKSSAKGPIPSLKPIKVPVADAKAKIPGNNSGPITFQQTFEQQLQSIQTDKPKVVKNKLQMPKLMPATPKAIMAANKLTSMSKTTTSTNPLSETKLTSVKPENILDLSTAHDVPGQAGVPQTKSIETKQPTVAEKQKISATSPSTDSKLELSQKPDNALDLTTPHTHTQLGPQQTFERKFEIMQTIVNLAKKQNTPVKPVPTSASQSSLFPSMSGRPLSSGLTSLKILPSSVSLNQTKSDNASKQSSSPATLKPDIKTNTKPQMDSQQYKYPFTK